MRRKARISAFQALFSHDYNGQHIEETLALIFTENKLTQTEYTYVENVMALYKINQELVDETIEKYIHGKWTLDRLGQVERSILRLAVLEILFLDDVPKKVAINEALELSKLYAEEKSRNMINGILDNVNEQI